MATRKPAPELPTLAPKNAQGWWDWLAAEHASSPGVWLKLAKKASGAVNLSYAEALDAALAWGWIDGQKGSLDETAWLQKFSPRRPRSIWSKINREKVQALLDAGKMQAPGLAAVAAAKQDGRWDAAYEPPSRATVPDDFKAAIAADRAAAAAFATLNATNRYAMLHRIHTAKKPETRARRIGEFVAMLARGDKLYP
jgi:uncharacterized protein YdeI (YjbR/CyaY-like superfamily)